MMKLRKEWYLSVLLGLTLVTGLVSCSSDDSESDYIVDYNSKITLPKARAFVLNEGSYQGNNSSLTAFNFNQDTICAKSLFLLQNGTKVGDTGEDLITDNENLYMLVYGSSYMVKMNGSGMKTASYTFTSTQGQPRKAIINGDYLYVSTYGGFILKFTKSDLKYVASCQVAANPENVVAYGGKLYVICNNGLDPNYNYTSIMDIVDESTFKKEDEVTVCYDPQKMIADANGNLFIQGYDASYAGVIYAYDKTKKTVTKIGGGTSMATKDGVLYIVNCVTNWSTNTTTTSFYSYNISTGKTETSSFLKNIPAALSSATVYSFDINPYDGSFYVGTTDYKTEGKIYHFTADGTYKTSFTSGGINPSHIVFMK